ncbi:GGDEF domain-containing protein [Rhizobium paknamense]|uniref:diguanylate cyclase n=1 Tax=Rhizobium paknamense TaxID=1206817 RepID=A0ABU0IFY8_9HYPH|nr:GGDEF domain-containing protein [Rhizobium paknamense]MDQ0457158.1 diguanylate cyclase (GGDEF)-like protein [Rhizobium paknamense]
MIRLREWLSLRRGFDDLSREGNVFGFVLRLMFLSISLSLLFQFVAIPLCRFFGLLTASFADSLKVGVAMSWLVSSFVATVTGLPIGLELRRLARAKAKYQYLSRVDELSGLLNRRAFTEVLEETSAEASLVIIDLDRFKLINDNHGHCAGDFVIRAVSDVLAETTAAGDVCARLGGEEFGLILRGKSRGERLALVETARLRVAALPLQFDGQWIDLTISAGVAEITPERRKEAIYAAADRALYRAKAEGRNRVIHEDDAEEAVIAVQAAS